MVKHQPTNKQIDFIVRSDAETKAGGDTHQTQQYVNELMQLGYDCRIVPIRMDMTIRPSANIHVINIDRPFDFLFVAKQLTKQKLFVSSIHHSLEYVRKMRKSEHDYGIRSIIGRNTSESTREWLAFGARQISSCNSIKDYVKLFSFLLQESVSARKVWTKVGKILDSASAVFILAAGEGTALVTDTKCSGKNFVITPNGIPEVSNLSASKKWKDRSIPVAVVGRIEPRKRQLDIAKAAAKLCVPIYFVGQASNPKSKYIQEFQSIIDSNPNLKWTGPLEHSKTIELLQDSKVLLNYSWVEVQSLVDIEAAAQGCQVVANRGGNSQEWLGEIVSIPEKTDAETAVNTAYEISEKAEIRSSSFRYNQSWKNTVKIIVDSYTEA